MGGFCFRLYRELVYMKKGFTLIELLVVVLIIGILSSVALPQYQKAVEKARVAEAYVALNAISKAQKLYYTANHKYTRDISDLDIEYPLEDITFNGNIPAKANKNWIFTSSNSVGDQSHIAVAQRRKNGTSTGASLYGLSLTTAGKKHCWLYAGSTQSQRKICREWADSISDFTGS